MAYKGEYLALGGKYTASGSVPTSGTTTISIPCNSGRNDWTCGLLFAHIPASVSLTTKRRMSFCTMFGREENDAQSRASELQIIVASSHSWVFPIMKGFSAMDDGYLSEAQYQVSGGSLRFKSVRYNPGTDSIDIVLQNVSSTTVANYELRFSYELFR